MNTVANYGIDAPPVIRNLAGIGVGLFVLGFFIGNPTVAWTSVAFFASAILMVLYAKVGKFRHRDRILGMVRWRGDERVLDVGTGRGLLLIGAARRLTTGRAVGIDIWQAADLSGNALENTLGNARVEGVADRVELLSEDARRMANFPSGHFDVVVSNLCLHNIPDGAGRAEACREIARVLKVGGVALISDFMKTGEYRKAFADAGLDVKLHGPYPFDTFPPLKIVEARKR